MPPKPTAPASRVSQTWLLVNAEKLTAAGGAGVARAGRHESAHEHDGDQSEQCDRPERRPPAEVLAEPGRGGHPHDVGDRQAEHDHRDRPTPTLGRRHRGGDQRRDTEVGAVRQAGEEPGEHEHPVAGGQGAEHVAEHERAHQRQQQAAPRQPGAEVGQHRRADHDAHGVRRDDVARGRDADRDPVSDLRQQAHGHELGGADREPAHGERHDREAEVGGAAGGLVRTDGGGGRHQWVKRRPARSDSRHRR